MGDTKIIRQRIDSLQALRAWAFLGIFFLHAGLMNFIDCAKLGVSVFFVMSGFLMTYSYENAEFMTSPGKCLSFSLGKIKKLYPLHLITMIASAVLSAAALASHGCRPGSIIKLCGEIVLNVTLLQSWVPDSRINVSLNGVAWYLSVALFLYFMFPWIKKAIERNSLIRLCIISICILAAEISACILLIGIVGSGSPIYIWFMYCFPVFRLGDFFTGCVLKRIFCECSVKNIGMARATIYEVLAAAITVLALIWLHQKPRNIILQALNNWTTIYIPLASVWVILFAVCKGWLTRILSNKAAVFVGNISAYAFLIHYVLIQYASSLLDYMKTPAEGWSKAILVSAELALSIALSVLYKHFQDRFLFRGKGKIS